MQRDGANKHLENNLVQIPSNMWTTLLKTTHERCQNTKGLDEPSKAEKVG